MNLKQLETFYWITKLGSFRATAERLNTTQSTVSMRINYLEKELGTELFHRVKRRARLTEKGRAMIPYAERAIDLAAEIYRVFDPKSVYSGTVKMGVSEIIGLTWLPSLVARLNESFPRLTVVLEMDLTARMRQKFENGDLDVVLIPRPIDVPGVRVKYVGSVEYRWMASPRLSVPEGNLTPKDLQKWPVLTLPAASNLHATIESWFRDNHAEALRLDICNTLAVAATLTTAGLGVSLLPYDVKWPLADPKLRVLKTQPRIEPIPYYVVYLAREDAGVAGLIAELAQGASTFRRRPPKTLRR